MSDTKTFDPFHLKHFTGTGQWYRHALVRSILFTDGAKYVADSAGAYWLLDEIALAQRFEPAIKVEGFQVWKLEVKDSAGILTCEDGNGQAVFPSTSPSPTFQVTASPYGSATTSSWCQASIDGHRGRASVRPQYHMHQKISGSYPVAFRNLIGIHSYRYLIEFRQLSEFCCISEGYRVTRRYYYLPAGCLYAYCRVRKPKGGRRQVHLGRSAGHPTCCPGRDRHHD